MLPSAGVDSPYIETKIIEGTRLSETNHQVDLTHNANSLLFTTKFVNLSSHHIVVAARDGTLSVMPPQNTGPYMQAILVGHNKSNYNASISLIEGDECDLNVALRDNLARNNYKSTYWEESVSIDKLIDNRNGVYLGSADVVLIMADRVNHMTHHPFCKQRVHHLYLNPGDDFNPAKDISISIRVVDNENTIRQLYSVFNGIVNVLIPKRSNTMSSGVYITGLTTLATEYSNSIRRDEYYSFDNVLTGKCPIKMFTTLREAQEAVSQAANAAINERFNERDHEVFINQVKREREKMEQENAQLKIQIAKDKSIADEISAQREREFLEQKLQHEKIILELKEESAQIANQQKSFTETAKLITVGIGLTLTLYKLFV